MLLHGYLLLLLLLVLVLAARVRIGGIEEEKILLLLLLLRRCSDLQVLLEQVAQIVQTSTTIVAMAFLVASQSRCVCMLSDCGMLMLWVVVVQIFAELAVSF